MAVQQSIYTTGGTVQAGGGIYLSRQADDELLQLCREGQFAYVLTPRQMGKSSLMVQTARRLAEEGIKSLIIDLTKIGTAVTPEQWYLGLLTEMDETLMFDTDIFGWWEQHNRLGVTQRLVKFFEEVLLREVDGRIAVFVDEIDTTLSLDFTDDFFIAIRYFYVARAQKEDFGRLSFVLIGVASPGDLIHDPKRTPFNIGRRIDLTNFSIEEALPLSEGLIENREQARQLLQRVLDWTCGHPYLTQRLCESIALDKCNHWSKHAIDKVVEKIFLSEGGRNDNNLMFVRDMLTRQTPYGNQSVSEILNVYKKIWLNQRAVLDEEQSILKSHLKLSGIVKRNVKRKTLIVSNEIYRKVFDLGWIRTHLPDKRIYSWRILGPCVATFILGASVAFRPCPQGMVKNSFLVCTDSIRLAKEGSLYSVRIPTELSPRFSRGDKILFTEESNPTLDRGAEAFRSRDYEQAAQLFEKAVEAGLFHSKYALESI